MACAGADLTISGPDEFAVATATAVDLDVTDAWHVGTGAIGGVHETFVILSSEAGWCDTETARLADLEAASSAFVADRDETDPLCDLGNDVVNTSLEADGHEVPRETLTLDVCAGETCSWDAVAAGTYDLYNAADPYLYGTLDYTTVSVATSDDAFDADACHLGADFDSQVAAATTTYDFDDGTLTFDTVDPGSTVKGSLEAVLYLSGTDSGTIRGTFATNWCEISVGTLVTY